MKLKILVTVLSVVLLGAAQSHAQNILANPNFEQGAAGWNFGPGSQLTNLPSKVIEGSISACTQILVFANQDFFSSTEQSVNINPANNYSFRLDVRPQFSNQSKGVRVGLLIVGRNAANGETFRRQKEVGATLPVITLDLDQIRFPAGTVRVEYKAFAYATQAASQLYQGQEFCFDRALATTAALTPLPKNTDILNNDFEYNTILWEEEGNPGAMISLPVVGQWSVLQELVPATANIPSFNRLSQVVYCNPSGSPCVPGQRLSAGFFALSYFDRDKVMDMGLMMQFVDANGNIIRDAANNPVTVQDTLNGFNWFRVLFVSTDDRFPAGFPPGAVGARIGMFQFAPKATVQAAALRLSVGDFFLTGNYPRALIFPLITSTTGENLDFENSLNRWKICCQPVDLDTVVKHGGNQSASINVNAVPAVDYFAEAAQRVVPVAGRTAILSGWVNTQAFSATSLTSAAIGVAAYDVNGNLLGIQSQSLQGRNNWTPLNVSLPVPAGAAELKLFYNLYGSVAGNIQAGEKARFDDFTFVQQ